MACSNAHSCILLSYHPETESGNFFLVTRDSHLMNVIIEVIDSMIKNEKIIEWNHRENKQLERAGENLLHKQISFET